MAGLFDALGALSPGDGYVDSTPPSSGGPNLMDWMKSLLGPTQAQQRAIDATNRAQIDPQIVQASPQEAAMAQMLGGGTGAPYGFGSAAIPQAASAPVTSNPAAPQAAAAPSVASPPPAVPSIPLGATIQAAQPDASTITPENDPTAGGSDPSAIVQSATGDLQQAAQSPEAAKGLLSSFADTAKNVADKLTNLSPNASQALISTGLSMLAANDGTRNLGQVIGIGGAAGLNNYQQNVTRQAQMGLAQQKLQQEEYLKLRQQALEEAKYRNTPVMGKPGESYITPGMIQGGQGPQTISGQAVARTVKIQGDDGKEYEQGVDYQNRPVGQPYLSKDPYAGPITGEANKTIADAATEAQTARNNLARTQEYIQKLSPTVTDANGNQVPNPMYTKVLGGLQGKAQDFFTQLTGDVTAGQQLKQQIQQQVIQTQLQNYKSGVGGRLTNSDIAMLQKGLAGDNANGETLRNYLQAYGKLQESMTDQAAFKSEFLQRNRGEMGESHAPMTIGGVTIPAHTTFGDAMKMYFGGGSGTSQSGNGGGSSGNIDSNILARARQAARNGDSGAQAALRKQGLSW